VLSNEQKFSEDFWNKLRIEKADQRINENRNEYRNDQNIKDETFGRAKMEPP
jgi:hypothetical protein